MTDVASLETEAARTLGVFNELTTEAIEAVKMLTEQHGEAAVSLMLTAAQLDAFSTALPNLLCFILFFVAMHFCLDQLKQAKKVNWDDAYFCFYFATLGWFVPAVLFIIGFVHFPLKAIFGVFVPEYWLLIKSLSFL